MKVLILLGILGTYLLRPGEWEGVCLVRAGYWNRACKGPGFLGTSFCGVYAHGAWDTTDTSGCCCHSPALANASQCQDGTLNTLTLLAYLIGLLKKNKLPFVPYACAYVCACSCMFVCMCVRMWVGAT